MPKQNKFIPSKKFKPKQSLMYKDSYNQRLKEIRDKYGASVKDTTSCIRSNDKPSFRQDSKYDDRLTDKYAVTKKLHDTKTDWRKSQNVDPSFSTLSSKYSSSVLKENDSFLHTQSKDERLKEIEKIRKEFAQSRNKAVDDFNRNMQKSKQKYTETQSYTLKERVNRTTATFNPEDFKTAIKEVSSNDGCYRGRSHSTFTSLRMEPDVKTNQELRRNYEYDEYESGYKESKVYDRLDTETKHLSSFRNNSVSRFDGENAKRDYRDYDRNDDFRSIKNIDSETTSPIRGLMKFDSVEKLKKVQIPDSYMSATANKLASNTYDLTNIDKIQDRIHRILAKK